MATTVPVSAYLAPGHHALLVQQAQSERRSISSVIETAITAYIVSEEAERQRDLATKREQCLAAFGGSDLG
jgi:hypothetical protein